MLELKKINRQNVWQVARLKVKRTQVDYVASNIESILEAFATREEGGVAEPFALYDGAALVGFAMIGYGDLPGEENPAISAGNYCCGGDDRRTLAGARLWQTGHRKADRICAHVPVRPGGGFLALL